GLQSVHSVPLVRSSPVTALHRASFLQPSRWNAPCSLRGCGAKETLPTPRRRTEGTLPPTPLRVHRHGVVPPRLPRPPAIHGDGTGGDRRARTDEQCCPLCIARPHAVRLVGQRATPRRGHRVGGVGTAHGRPGWRGILPCLPYRARARGGEREPRRSRRGR